LLLAWQVHTIAQSLPRRFEVHAFLKTDVPRERAMAVAADLSSQPGVTHVDLVPREEAWAQLRKSYPRPDDLQGLEDNPLPDKLEIAAVTPEASLALAQQVRALPEVDGVRAGEDVVRNLMSVADGIRLAGLVLAGLLALGTAAIVANAIRLTLLARRKDIRLMQLVGATNDFIRLPLVLEGMLQGAAGAALACAVVLVALHYVNARVVPALPLVTELRLALDLRLFCAALVAGGALLGVLGSFFSLRKFLPAS
jgi:cell division transport system permease protein